MGFNEISIERVSFKWGELDKWCSMTIEKREWRYVRKFLFPFVR